MLDLFPALRGKQVACHVLLTDFDVAEFEALRQARRMDLNAADEPKAR